MYITTADTSNMFDPFLPRFEYLQRPPPPHSFSEEPPRRLHPPLNMMLPAFDPYFPAPRGRLMPPCPSRPPHPPSHRPLLRPRTQGRPDPPSHARTHFRGRFLSPVDSGDHQRGMGRGMLARRPPQISRMNYGRADLLCSVPGYEVVKPLKAGGMSENINLVKSRVSGRLYIEKRIRNDGWCEKDAKAELSALHRFGRDSRHINYMTEYCYSPGHLSFILEYCDSGSLGDLMREYDRNHHTFSSEYLWHILLGIAKGLAYMHEGIDTTASNPRPVRRNWNSTFHLDLKPDNVFLTSIGQIGRYPRVVIGDFGCVVTKEDIVTGLASPRHQNIGDPAWYPPEHLEKEVGRGGMRYGSESDVWQMGAIIQCLAQSLSRPKRSRLESELSVGSAYSGTLNTMVRTLCRRDWRSRPTALMVARDIDRSMSKHEFRLH